MTDVQKAELNEYIYQVREASHCDSACLTDAGVIKDYIEANGDHLSFESIERFIRERRFAGGTRDRGRRFLYRWKMWKEGVDIGVIVGQYMDQFNHSRACEILGCPDRDQYGFCSKKYRVRASCPTLKQIDELARDPEVRKKAEKKEPDKADWLFGKVCSYKDAACAVFKGNL